MLAGLVVSSAGGPSGSLVRGGSLVDVRDRLSGDEARKAEERARIGMLAAGGLAALSVVSEPVFPLVLLGAVVFGVLMVLRNQELRDKARELLQRVAQMMTTDLFTVQEEDTVTLAEAMMRWERIRHIPVENEAGALVGMLSLPNLLDTLKRGNGQIEQGLKVGEIMERDPVSVTPETPTLEAIALMKDNGLSGLQNIPGLTHVPQSVLSVWFLWASAVALALGYLLAAWVISGKFGNVIRGIRDIGDFEVSVSAYPEKHSHSPDFETDLDVLAAKVDAGATRAITQFFFENDTFYRYRDRGIQPAEVLRQAMLARANAMRPAKGPDQAQRGVGGLSPQVTVLTHHHPYYWASFQIWGS